MNKLCLVVKGRTLNWTTLSFSLLLISGIIVPVFAQSNFDDLSKWEYFWDGDLELSMVHDSTAEGDSAIKVTNLVTKDNWWDSGVQSIPDFAISDSMDKTFNVSFRYRADSNRKLWVSIRYRPRGTYGSEDKEYYGGYVNDAKETYQDFNYTFSSVATAESNATVHIQFFVAGQEPSLYLDDIIIKEKESVISSSTTYYVNPLGKDANNGTANTEDEAWKTMSHGFRSIQAGDTLLIADGVYSENEMNIQDLIGNEDNWTLIKSINQYGAKLVSTSEYNAINVRNSQYVVIDGLEITHEDVENNNDSGIALSDRWNDTPLSHHITLRNSYLHDSGEQCIRGGGGDYITIENNIVRDCSKNSEYNGSGISIYHPEELDKNPGYHIIIRNNVVFENECRLPFTPGGFDTPTDGNGIILDDFERSQSPAGTEPYRQATLIENNLTFNNGGAGIKAYRTQNITIRNNTMWRNNFVLDEYSDFNAELSLQYVGGDIQVYNNIMVQHPDQGSPAAKLDIGYAMDTLDISNNIFVGTYSLPGNPVFENNLTESKANQNYPGFGQPTTEVEFTTINDFKNYFGLRITSPALNAGNDNNASFTDLNGVERPISDASDIGAYEGIVEGVDPVSNEDVLSETPKVLVLSQNYPNPFNPFTNITYQIPEAGQVQLQVYDMLGRKVATLVEGRVSVGSHTISFDASSLSSGLYIYRLITAKNAISKTMLLIK